MKIKNTSYPQKKYACKYKKIVIAALDQKLKFAIELVKFQNTKKYVCKHIQIKNKGYTQKKNVCKCMKIKKKMFARIQKLVIAAINKKLMFSVKLGKSKL